MEQCNDHGGSGEKYIQFVQFYLHFIALNVGNGLLMSDDIYHLHIANTKSNVVSSMLFID